MRKKYIVRLSEEERATLREVIRRQKGSATKVRRAQILLKADADGPNWTDAEIVEAFGCRRRTVEMVRERLVTEGFEDTLNGKTKSPRPTKLDGAQEAKVIAMRLGPPPAGYANWTLKLLADRVVALEIVDSISYETVRRTLKKTGSRRRRSNTG
ncbi:MAG TPA: helix-turn-helix domain-containing protein [Fimbriiglobus sp.]